MTASEDDIIMHRAFLRLLRRLAVDDEVRKAIGRRIVIALIDPADNKQSGMLSLLTLNDAATKAQQAG